MATNNENRGLLTRMARMIRGQSDDQAEAGLSEQGQDSEFNKHALKERIERKRQDDIVRRREFEHLRKLRNTSPLIAGTAPARSSTFQNSTGFNQEDRALTVKKIDDIEATMSRNWLDRKPAESTVSKSPAPAPVVPTLHAGVNPSSIPVLGKKQPLPLSHPDATEPMPLRVPDEDEFDFTKLTAYASPAAVPPASPKAASAVPAPAPAPAPAFRRSRRGGLDAGVSVFSSSMRGPIDFGTPQTSPEMQDAAIRFAEGDESGAEEVLLAALNADATEPELGQAYCAALFDLYRGTGQQASFDEVAIDFAQRYGKSAPEWFSTPELLGQSAATSEADPAVRPVLSRQIMWECPATLDLKALRSLRTSLTQGTATKHLNWGGLKTIAPDAAPELAELFASWCKQAIELHFAGTDSLTQVLQAATPSDDATVDQVWWQLRLDALRILRLHDDFESTALDFCVVYELSPPAWSEPLCTCVHELVVDDDSPASVYDSVHPESASMGLDGGEAAILQLSGEVLGDAAAALDKLHQGDANADALLISCARLIRVDFTAAGNILNWAAKRQAQGCQIQFRDVPRLVAAFFSVIGIDEHASVVLRVR